MQYLLSSEIFPLRIRAFCAGLAMVIHFANQYGCSRAVPEMLLPTEKGGIGAGGTFWLFTGVTVLGGLWVKVWVGEWMGRELEEGNSGSMGDDEAQPQNREGGVEERGEKRTSEMRVVKGEGLKEGAVSKV